MKLVKLILSAGIIVGSLYAGGLPEDIVKEPEGKATYGELPVETYKAPVIVIEEVKPEPVVEEVKPVIAVRSKPVVEPIVEESPWFVDIGVGLLSTDESYKLYDRCGNAYKCGSTDKWNIGAFTRLGYTFEDYDISPYAEVGINRGLVGKDENNAKYLNTLVGVKYVAYDSFIVFASLGKQFMTIKDTDKRDIMKLGAGYKFNDSLSAELSLLQSSKLKLSDFKTSSTEYGLWLVYTF